jgi:hypothetical protein
LLPRGSRGRGRLHRHPGLAWAQAQAADAIREYNDGQAATKQAQADHTRAVQQAQAQAASSGMPAPNIPFTDPGEAKRSVRRAKGAAW